MGTRLGSITFGGLSSGLPTDDIVSQLLELSRRPIDVLRQQRDDFSARLEVYQDLNTKTTALRDVLRGLDNMADVIRQADDDPLPAAFEEFRRFTATSSDKNLATGSVGSDAVAGNLTFSVDQLAQQQRSIDSGGFASTSAVVTAAGGTLTIDSTGIAIDPGATVAEVVSAINAEGLGVTAFALDDGQGAADSVRIAIVGDETGTAAAFTVSSDFGVSFENTQSAQNAQITVDPAAAGPVFTGGLTIQSSNNTFEDVIQGLTINALAETSGSTITITIDTSVDEVVDSVSELVSAYNAIVDVINEQNTVNPETNRGGPLIGDSAMVSLGQRLARSVASEYGSGSITTSSALGLSLGRDGRISIDETDLRDKLESSFGDVVSFFAGAGSFSDRMREIADSFVDPVTGGLVSRINGTTDSIADVDSSISAAEDRLATVEENLLRQFSALERTVSNFQQQGNFLASFLLAGSQQ